MKRLLLTLGFFSASLGILLAQVKIGENPQALNSTSLLELESSTRVFVLSRVTQGQMDAITPLPGALVYNTDASCIFQYDGSNWVNLCQALNLDVIDNNDGTFTFITGNGPITFDGTGVNSFELNDQGEIVLSKSNGETFTVPILDQFNNNFTTDPIVNDASTIVITDTGNALNFEVGNITGANIADGTINGFFDIQFESITENQMASGSIGTQELQNGSITAEKIDLTTVTLSDFLNDPGFITSTEIVSNQPGNAIQDLNGAFYDDSALLSSITTNVNNIQINASNILANQTAIAADTDNNSTNEIQNLTQVLAEGNNAGGQSIKNLADPVDPQDAATKNYIDSQSIEDADANPTNEIQVISEGNGITVTPSGINYQITNSLPDQTITIADGGGGNIEVNGTYPNFTLDLNGVDLSNTNELQSLQLTGRSLGTTSVGTTVSVNALNSIRTSATPLTVILDSDYTLVLNGGVTNLEFPLINETGRIVIIKNLSGGNVTSSVNYVDGSGATVNLLLQGITWLQNDGITWQQIN